PGAGHHQGASAAAQRADHEQAADDRPRAAPRHAVTAARGKAKSRPHPERAGWGLCHWQRAGKRGRGRPRRNNRRDRYPPVTATPVEQQGSAILSFYTVWSGGTPTNSRRVGRPADAPLAHAAGSGPERLTPLPALPKILLPLTRAARPRRLEA